MSYLRRHQHCGWLVVTAKELAEIEARVKRRKALPWNSDVDVVALCDEVRRLWSALKDIACGDGQCNCGYGGCDTACRDFARRHVPDDYEEKP